MTFDADLEDLMTTTVTYAASTGMTGGGAQTFGTSLTIQARIEPGSRLVRDQTGREVVSGITLFLKPTSTTGSTYMPTVKDKITLPSPYAPTNPQIIAVRIHADAESEGDSWHHFEISC